MTELCDRELQDVDGGMPWIAGILLGLAIKEVYDGVSAYLKDGCSCQ